MVNRAMIDPAASVAGIPERKGSNTGPGYGTDRVNDNQYIYSRIILVAGYLSTCAGFTVYLAHTLALLIRMHMLRELYVYRTVRQDDTRHAPWMLQDIIILDHVGRLLAPSGKV